MSERAATEERMRRLDEVARAERRRHYRATSMSDRLEEALELSRLARDLRAGMRRAR